MRQIAMFLSLTLILTACGGSKTTGTTGGDTSNGGDSDTTGGSLTVQIVRPNGNLSILSGSDVTLEAEFLEDGNPVFPGTVNWDTDVFLGSGNPLANVQLADGAHVITVTGAYNGKNATDSVTVTVGDFAVRIRNPDNGAIEDAGGNVRFRGEAFTNDAGPTQVELVATGAGAGQRVATYAWSSTLDAAWSSAANDFQDDTLSEGTHTITLTVTDNDPTNGSGRSGSASVTLVIAPPNTSPTVAITDPATCPVEVQEGGTLTFTGTVTDPDPADAGLQGTWTDSVTGDTATGGGYTLNAGTTLGLREIVFSATDNRGETDSATCEVWVVAAGGSVSDFFPDTTGVNGGLVGGNDNVNWIGVDPDGNTWVGNDEGLTVFDGTGSAVGTYDGNALDVGNGANVQDAAIAGGTAFIATDNGLVECDYAGGALSNCTSIQGGDFEGVATSADPGIAGYVAGATDGGLYLAAFSGGAMTDDQTFDPGNSNLPADTVQDVVWSGDTLYVATDAGLCIVEDPAAALAGTTDLCSEILRDGNSLLPDNDVMALALAGDDLWIGADGGLARYDTATGAMEIWDEDRGLVGDARKVNDIAIDAAGILWLGTDDGLVRLDPTTGSVTIISGADWVPPAPGENVDSVYIDAAGTKWLATSNGVVQYSGS